VGSLFQQRDPTVQDAETGIQLQVTPRLAPDGRVLMELRPGFAAAIRSSQNVQADNETFGVMFPSIVTKDIKTNVTIESGQTVVIGGLMEQGQMTVQQGVPWLKDLPIINYLFTTRKNYDEQTKLMIMITPYIVDSEDR
jgi:type II secretory pathway component GspD/PulD (secretin)